MSPELRKWSAGAPSHLRPFLSCPLLPAHHGSDLCLAQAVRASRPARHHAAAACAAARDAGQGRPSDAAADRGERTGEARCAVSGSIHLTRPPLGPARGPCGKTRGPFGHPCGETRGGPAHRPFGAACGPTAPLSGAARRCAARRVGATAARRRATSPQRACCAPIARQSRPRKPESSASGRDRSNQRDHRSSAAAAEAGTLANRAARRATVAQADHAAAEARHAR